MTGQIRQDLRNGVAVLLLDRPVANALSAELRAELAGALDHAATAAEVRAVVLAGSGSGFSSGVDLTEYDGPLAEPWIDALCTRIEDFPKPVIAALHGPTFGAGLALALAAHARIAQAEARLASPEITLGMVPGGGVTQRLPRLLGAQVALEVMLAGQTLRATDPRLRRLFSQVTADDPLPAAVDLAGKLADQGHWRRSQEATRGLSDPAGYQRAIATVAERLKGQNGAASDILRAVEAAQLLPFAQGLAFEATLFEDRLRSPEARAQRHIYAAERRASGMPERAQAATRDISRIALAGARLGDVALLLLEGGKVVRSDAPDLRASVSRALDGLVTHGKIEAATRAAHLARLTSGMAPVDLALCTRGSEVADGTLSVPLDDGRGLAGAPLGLRLYRPAQTLRLAELAVSDTADPAIVASLAQLCTGLGVTLVRAAQPAAGPGLGHILMGAVCLAGLEMVRLGLTPQRVDQAAQRLGFRAGPFLMMDFDGLPVVANRLRAVAEWLGCPAPGADDPLAERLAKGAVGRAVGRGFYDHPSEGPRPPKNLAGPGRDPAEVLGTVAPRHALQAALVGAAVQLLARGAVQRASDLDVLMVRVYGYDRARGGPLFAADQRGMLAMLQDFKALATMGTPLWQVPPMVVEMVKNGEGMFGRRHD
ncbi:putative enoyl-CoA hydratase [Roseovarius sp. EC-HK134]|uniref:enoyl-CoA hydratase-related protein n=1 Tax=unclassified Roseovarius TaxID=2614913 RepID=UPI0012588067|nr:MULTISPECIES: enoyl-CoA hydratase-related protein [unclassified Roseovarius]VVT24626.1 putative enoyl-CoA hydratase [Roseovarius sp. EC-SD190]VVT24872.1 putative enoyl-CoA hydratase [Roseovarius sp. EC-HK134]